MFPFRAKRRNFQVFFWGAKTSGAFWHTDDPGMSGILSRNCQNRIMGKLSRYKTFGISSISGNPFSLSLNIYAFFHFFRCHFECFFFLECIHKSTKTSPSHTPIIIWISSPFPPWVFRRTLPPPAEEVVSTKRVDKTHGVFGLGQVRREELDEDLPQPRSLDSWVAGRVFFLWRGGGETPTTVQTSEK